MSLSESMDARGFGFEGSTRGDQYAGWCGLGALLSLAGAFVALVGRASTAAVVLGVVGIAFLVAAGAFASGRTRDRRRYRHRRMARADWLMVGVRAHCSTAHRRASGFAGNDSLTWHTSPLHWPTFEPLVALALVPAAGAAAPRAASADCGGRAGIDLPEPELLPEPTPEPVTGA